ncbi:MAG: hypothetical protein HY720_31550, partial [Planctomycetes bacterium]|nr:hypothetical protein [Planctomycetota bacterium]
VEWRCAGRATEIDEGLATWLEGHLAHLVSNAVRHGVELEVEREAAGKSETATIWISAEIGRGGLRIEVGDDGRGLDEAGAPMRDPGHGLERRPARPAASRTRPGDLGNAAGGGLAELEREVRARGGRIAIWTERGRGTRVRLRAPFRSARAAVLPAEARGLVGFPVERVLWIRGQLAGTEPVGVLGGRTAPPVQSLSRLLWGAREGAQDPTGPAVLLDSSQGLVALAVDAVGAPETVVLHALDLAGSGVAAASFREAAGRIGWLLDADALAGLVSYAESKKRLAEEGTDA